MDGKTTLTPALITPTMGPHIPTAQRERESLGVRSWRSNLRAVLAIAWKDWTVFFR